MVFLFWAAKEIRDLVAVELDCKNVWFRPSMRDLVLNVLCAIFYFTIGIILAITTMVENTVWFIPLILIFGVAYAYPWLKLKINLQNSNMTFMTRISEFDEKKLDDESRIIIQNLIDGNAGSFLIAGKNGEDKSTLGMAIVSEYIFNGNTARYFTFEQFLENDNNIEEKMVVVDNINPFLDGDDDARNPDQQQADVLDVADDFVVVEKIRRARPEREQRGEDKEHIKIFAPVKLLDDDAGEREYFIHGRVGNGVPTILRNACSRLAWPAEISATVPTALSSP